MQAKQIAIGVVWHRMKDDDSLAGLSNHELTQLLKAQGLNKEAPYLQKCLRLFQFHRTGRLKEMATFRKETGFRPENSYEPYASMETEAALTKFERTGKLPDNSPAASNDQKLIDYLGDQLNPPSVTFITGDCRTEIEKIPDNSLDVITGSPAFHGMRDYEHRAQMGQENTEELYRLALVSFLNVARAKLKSSGILALVVGDRRSNGPHVSDRNVDLYSRTRLAPTKRIADTVPQRWPLLIPFNLFQDLVADGWWPIQIVIWHKTRCQPESVQDRCHIAHDYVLLLAKTEHYHWNVGAGTPLTAAPYPHDYQKERGIDNSDNRTKPYQDVWSFPTVTGDPTLTHPARHPDELYRRILRLTCPASGHVLDPWGGSGTTAVAALGLGLHSTLIELYEPYMIEAKARMGNIPQARKWRKPLVTPQGKLIHGDALTEIRKLESDSVGFIPLDPPYGNGATMLPWDEDLEWGSIWEELWRVVTIDGFVAVCCNARLMARLIEIQPTTFRYLINWYQIRHSNVMQGRSQPKRHVGFVAVFGRVAQSARYQPKMTPKATPQTRQSKRLSTEFFGKRLGFSEDGDITLDAEGPDDLRYYDFEPGEKRKFPTQKPIAMGVDLIKSLSRPVVLDICAGSASFLLAAMRCGRQFIGVERDEGHFGIACDRLVSAGSEVRADAAD